MPENPPPTFQVAASSVQDLAIALEYQGRNFEGWGLFSDLEIDGSKIRINGWVTKGSEGKLTLSVPMDVVALVQGRIVTSFIMGVRRDGGYETIGTLVLNGLEQP